MHIFISMDDIFGEAIWDYHLTNKNQDLIIHNYYGEPEKMPIEVYFRNEDQLSEQEEFALSLAKGNVLEIGAGAGALCSIMINRGMSVTALEISPLCVKVMKERGIENAHNVDFFLYESDLKYDTIYLMMNGLGLCETLPKLRVLFSKLATLLADGGQVLFDSSNVDYVYDKLPLDKYYGEIDYCNEYKNRNGDWFKWLYVDFLTMEKYANELGFEVQLIMEDENAQYLARAVKSQLTAT